MIKKLLNSQIQSNISLKKFSSFKIGGLARYFINVHEESFLKKVLEWCVYNKCRYIVIGNGSNIVFDERGFQGLVIHNCIRSIDIQDEFCIVSAGVRLDVFIKELAKRGLAGMEFAVGIPGTVGGAVFMNAGAGAFSIGDIIEEVYYMDKNSRQHVLKSDKLKFSYRYSSFQDIEGSIILGAKLRLSDSKEDLLKKQSEILSLRLKKQPYNSPSIGSVFRNPDNNLSAGELIDGCGLKGTIRGGAQISEKHANFIVNIGGATSEDVLELVKYIKDTVYLKRGVLLKEEYCYVV